MISILQPSSKLTFTEFLAQRPEEGRYEWVDGAIVRILATRRHDDVADFIQDCFNEQVKQLQLPYKVSNRIVLATTKADGTEQGRHPDVSVIHLDQWRSNRSAYSALRQPIQLAVEVVSTNWEDDYIDKLAEYQRLGIREYWVVDYLAIGSRELLGNPKVPSVLVYLLEPDQGDQAGQYQFKRFQGSDRILSATFPDLSLTVEQISAV